jgi:hypothetical protein
MLVVERGSVDGALRILALIPVLFDYVRGIKVLERIARGSLWLLQPAAVATDAHLLGGDVGFEGDPSAEDGRAVEAEA